MAYLGTPPKSRVLSSADIATGAVTLDDISFTDQSTSVNVSGAINKHTMRLSDEVVIDGNLNITDNLILSKISDDGNAITLTTDGSTRTITGTGSLEASTLTQTPNASLTGMTGTMGSGVTFPAGHIVQIVSDDITTAAESDNTNSGTLILVERGSNIYDWKKQITGVTAGNWVYVTMGFKFFSYRATTDVLGCGFGIFHSTADDGSGTSVIYEQAGDTQYFHIAQASGGSYQNAEYIQFSYMHKSPSAGNNTYYLGYKGQNNGSDHVRVMSQAIAGATGGTPFHVTLMEIQQ